MGRWTIKPEDMSWFRVGFLLALGATLLVVLRWVESSVTVARTTLLGGFW